MADLYTTQTVNSCFAALESGARRRRQEASRSLAELAYNNPALLGDSVDKLVAALSLPEAQTRWQIMDALLALAPSNMTKVAAALEPAEESLFDEDSSPCRLSAFRLIACIGQSTSKRSERAWPLLDEAIQCYHGDAEYREMLAALIDFSKGSIAKSVAAELAERVSFDAENADGYIGQGSQEILDILAKRKK